VRDGEDVDAVVEGRDIDEEGILEPPDTLVTRLDVLVLPGDEPCAFSKDSNVGGGFLGVVVTDEVFLGISSRLRVLARDKERRSCWGRVEREPEISFVKMS
jgi:hypothetical protein